ncbi:MAG: DUF4238 domain-containing protein [Candidatus Brocadiaceae bacterium]|nr:DUF4238 domain-containing protein [Candidatus Brocadiaceae bacterium]
MEVNVKNQHYVWRHYLKPWMTNGKIWCIRDSAPFFINPEKIAKEDYFYSADKLNKSEKMILEPLISAMGQGGEVFFNSIYSMYVSSSHSSDFVKNNTIEDYHGKIEKSVMSILEQIYSDDLSFWKNQNQRVNFSSFVGIQYTRTKKVIERTSEGINNLKQHPSYPIDADPKKISKVLSLFTGEKIGNWLYTETQPKIIKNNSDEGFLTSDQPVFNLLAESNNNFGTPEKVKLYFPVTPKLALVFEDKNEITSNKKYEADKLNRFVIKSSREFVFSETRELLLYYKKAFT